MSKKNPSGLTDLQEGFCRALVLLPDRNASKAYMATFDSCKKPSTARANSSKLLTKTDIRTFIMDLDQEAMAKWDITSERNNKEKACLAYFNPKSILDEHGNLLPVQDWPDEAAAAIESIHVEKRKEGRGEDAEEVQVVKITWAKKGPILDQISKQLGDYERDNKQKTGTMADLIKAVDGSTRGLPPPEEVE